MKYLRRFNENISIYDPKWEALLPDELTVVKGYDNEIKNHLFKKGNVMLNADMVQITYENQKHEWGYPDTLEIDIYFAKDVESDSIKLDVDITWGDEVASSFTIQAPDKIKIGQYTSYHSKFDPSNTVFGFDDKSLNKFIEFLNRFNHGIELSIDDFKFLDQYNDYTPQ
jgi:hypothetical protein